jgi:hypothetical protein
MKRLGLLIGAMMCVMGLRAECPEGFTDKVDATQYLTDIQLDLKTGVLTFTDNFMADQELTRDYNVYFYRSNGECPFYYDSEYGVYEYGQYNQFLILNAQTSNHFCHCTGGQRTYPIESIVNKVKASGYTSVYMAIKPVYYTTDPVSGTMFGKTYYYKEETEIKKHLWLVNGVNMSIPTISGLGITLPDNAHFEQDMNVRVDMTCMHRCSFILSWSSDGTSWGFIESAIIEAYEAKNGAFRNITFSPTSKNLQHLYFRLEVWDLVSDYKQTFYTTDPLAILYPLDNKGVMWYKKGEKVEIPYEECKDIQISSEKYVETEHKKDGVVLTMPGCKVDISHITSRYTVTFYNADGSLWDTQEVACGEDAQTPANTPKLGKYTFIGWDKDYTNVQKDLKVFAKYDLGGDYYLMPSLYEHKNEVYEYYGFKDNETRVMVGDVLTYKIGMLAVADATLYYETAQWNNSEQKWIWGDGKKIADYVYVPSNPERLFDSPEIQVCYDKNTEFIHPYEYRFAVRFYMMLAGQKVYSDPFEYDVFYPLTIQTADKSDVMAESNAGYYHVGWYLEFPARYNDTLRVYNWNGAGGKCFQYSPSVPNDIDENGNAYFLAPGEKTTITLSTSKYAVLFDEAFPTKPYDFSAEGLGKYNVYYAEVVTCGEGVQNVPEDPKSDGQIFKGWYNNSPDTYADDDYMHIPAVGTPYITFSAKWEDVPDVQKFTVRFYGKDGNPLLDTQTIDEGQNATPPTPPTVDGWHFVEWDKPYTTITANTDITAIYGEDSKIWTVTYYDEDGTTKLGDEQVEDKMPANGLKLYKEGGTFLYWQDMATDKKADLSSITADMNVKAVFEWPTPPPTPETQYYKVTLVAEHGKITVEEDDIDLDKVKENTVLHFTAKPDEGYLFKEWNGYNPETGLKVTANKTVEAIFEKKPEQGIEEVKSEELRVKSQKFIIDGRLYILRDGKTYSILGMMK